MLARWSGTGFLTIMTILIVTATLGFLPARAQEVEPAAGDLAASYLPRSRNFGDGWTTLPPTGVSNLTTSVFQEAAVGYYGGLDGSRAMVMVFIVTDARIAIRQAWDEVSSRFDTYRYALTSDSNRDLELANIPPPTGCEEVKRSEGTDCFTFVTAITLCAGSDNVIVLAMVSGGDATTLRYQASDALATAAIQRGAE